VLASALTIVALPAVWLVNQDDSSAGSSRPNVAAVGLPAADGVTTAPADTGPIDPMGDVPARYLEGTPLPPAPHPAPVAVGSIDGVLVARARATYRRSVGSVGTCAYSGVRSGTLITVVNVDNNRSVECRTVLRPLDEPQDELVLHPDRFAGIADLTSAPIDVEIRQ
jgi:hypothetical protein